MFGIVVMSSREHASLLERIRCAENAEHRISDSMLRVEDALIAVVRQCGEDQSEGSSKPARKVILRHDVHGDLKLFQFTNMRKGHVQGCTRRDVTRNIIDESVEIKVY